jgi:HEAT repeat protein
LINTLNNADNWKERRDAAEALSGYSGSEVVNALISTLEDETENRDVRFKCAETLGKIGDPAAVEPLIAALDDDKAYIVARSAEALGLIGDERAVEPLIQHLDPSGSRHDGDYGPTRACIEALGKFGPRVTQRMLGLVDDEVINGEVIRALALTGDEAALPALIACLRDTEIGHHYRVDAVKGLARFDHPDSKKALLDLLENAENQELIQAAKQSLEKLGIDASEQLTAADRRAEQALLRGLKALKIGMNEMEIVELIGKASWVSGSRVTFRTKFGDFDLIIANGKLIEIPTYVYKLINELEGNLPEEAVSQEDSKLGIFDRIKQYFKGENSA